MRARFEHDNRTVVINLSELFPAASNYRQYQIANAISRTVHVPVVLMNSEGAILRSRAQATLRPALPAHL